MGLMDKVKQQAEQALTKAQQGVAQGQAKLDEVQAKRQADLLLRDLGAAYYAAERQGGPVEDVSKALSAFDELLASQAAAESAAATTTPSPDAAASATTTAATPSSAPSGDYKLDDL